MPRRQDSFGYGVTIPATTARVVDTAVEILGDPDPDELAFLHSVLAQTFLPYRDPKTRDYVRESGRASLVLTAGYLLDPTTRKPVLQGLPYGTRPRLLLVHLCTQAMRRRSPVIPIGDSMSAFMRDLGLKVTGGKHGTIGRFQDQLHRLAAARSSAGPATRCPGRRYRRRFTPRRGPRQRRTGVQCRSSASSVAKAGRQPHVEPAYEGVIAHRSCCLRVSNAR